MEGYIQHRDWLHRGNAGPPATPVVSSEIVEQKAAEPIGYIMFPDGSYNSVYSESARPVNKGKIGYV